mmetsp:Transcript_43123/g.69474  ORF Transcript_43123/g.69474 Transcript_43123/m.69474 type:complete len:93 (+) Transcript_43123:1754-2032(+)
MPATLREQQAKFTSDDDDLSFEGGKLLGGSKKPKVTCERQLQQILRYVSPPRKITVPKSNSLLVWQDLPNNFKHFSVFVAPRVFLERLRKAQ